MEWNDRGIPKEATVVGRGRVQPADQQRHSKCTHKNNMGLTLTTKAGRKGTLSLKKKLVSCAHINDWIGRYKRLRIYVACAQLRHHQCRFNPIYTHLPFTENPPATTEKDGRLDEAETAKHAVWTPFD